MGRQQDIYTSSSVTERTLYYATLPNGLPIAGYEVDSGPAPQTTEIWRATWTPFGEMLTETTSDPDLNRPPHRFIGQTELPRSDASWWSGTTLIQSRPSLVLNRRRVYDPHVGQYLQPEPWLVNGTVGGVSPYAYAALSPEDFVDPDGLYPRPVPDTCSSRPDICPYSPHASGIRPVIRPPGGAGHLPMAGGGLAAAGGAAVAAFWPWRRGRPDPTPRPAPNPVPAANRGPYRSAPDAGSRQCDAGPPDGGTSICTLQGFSGAELTTLGVTQVRCHYRCRGPESNIVVECREELSCTPIVINYVVPSGCRVVAGSNTGISFY